MLAGFAYAFAIGAGLFAGICAVLVGGVIIMDTIDQLRKRLKR